MEINERIKSTLKRLKQGNKTIWDTCFSVFQDIKTIAKDFELSINKTLQKFEEQDKLSFSTISNYYKTCNFLERKDFEIKEFFKFDFTLIKDITLTKKYANDVDEKCYALRYLLEHNELPKKEEKTSLKIKLVFEFSSEQERQLFRLGLPKNLSEKECLTNAIRKEVNYYKDKGKMIQTKAIDNPQSLFNKDIFSIEMLALLKDKDLVKFGMENC